MEDWNIVSIESELDRMRDERPEIISPATRTKSKIGCLAMICYFVAGIALVRILGELLNVTIGN